MYKEQKILVVVPARGGSKGIKLKNLVQINGASLIEHVARVIKQVPEIDLSIVSTDHPDIAAEAVKFGIEAPFLRPEGISGDFIADWDVLSHALLSIEKLSGKNFDVIVMLQPTSPLRTHSEVFKAIKLLIDGGYDAVWSLSKTDLKYHPLKQLTLNHQNGVLNYFDPLGSSIIARQQLTDTYYRNGVVYAVTRSCLLDQKTIKGNNSAGFISEGLQISIDTDEDVLKVSKYLMGDK
jgi:CMP-N,N'-diacetyllegionaminic acid synthase